MSKVKIEKKELLSNNWSTLHKVTFKYLNKDDKWESQTRETYDRGNGAVILLYNLEKRTVILTRQFRIPTYVNGNKSGMLIEACAGSLDGDSPENCIKRETEEETGYRINDVQQIFESYMSPGSVTEILYFFIAKYDDTMKVTEGGGVKEEQEDIEVLELDFDHAFHMISTGEIKDGKTIMLLQYAKINNLI